MRQIRNALTALALVFAAVAARPVTAQTVAAAIQTISPASGRPGDTVTITGQGFGAFNVRITVGGVPANVVSANGNRVTFIVPLGVNPGVSSVTATNPGGHAGSIAFRVLEGVLLPGTPADPALAGTTDMLPVAAASGDIVNGLIMTRLDVRLRPGATIGQVNTALARIDGGIVTMLKGHLAVTIAIPPPATIAALQSIVDTLNVMPGIAHASFARTADHKVLPVVPGGPALSQLSHLLPTAFPAAWNASRLATTGCAGRQVPIVVADQFDTVTDTAFFSEIPSANFTFFAMPTTPGLHGDEVTTTMAADFDGSNPTGAVPFPECLDIHAVAVDGLSMLQEIVRIQTTLPSGKFLMNYSRGYVDKLTCLVEADGCSPDEVHAELVLALDRAYDAIDWKLATRDRWRDFLVAVAAGNELNLAGTAVYAGLGMAPFDSMMSVATIPDASFAFVTDSDYWGAHGPLSGGLPSLSPFDAEMAVFELYVAALDPAATAVPDNVLLVGATATGTAIESLAPASYSDTGSNLSAVGNSIFTATGTFVNGTSFATPQVTGLAAYLWLLSSGAHAKNAAVADLSAQPAAITRRAILDNAQAGVGADVIDAYASALSLDPAAAVDPRTTLVRLAVLDVNDSGRFDEDDLTTFVNAYFDSGTGEPFEPATRSYSRLDLNGDGYKGGSSTARFDLDRVGSTQFGAALYSTVLQNIGGDVGFDEHGVTDLEILCYYAYSPLYTPQHPDLDVREQLLAGRCAPVTVKVDPPTASMTPGATQAFTATVHGTTDSRVTWSASGGTVTPAGVFTAGSGGGTFTVRATSVRDPDVFGEATVTIAGSTSEFRADQEITTRVGATDPLTLLPLVQEFLEADNESPLPPLPLVLDKSGTLHQEGADTDATFRMRSTATFSNSRLFFVPSTGTHSASVLCTTDAERKGPATGGSATGSLRIPAVAADGRTPADITLTLGGAVSRGSSTGDLGGTVSYSGSVNVNWTSGGVTQTAFGFNTPDFTAAPAVAPIERTLHVTAPGFVEIHWAINASCQSRGSGETASTNGAIALTYRLAR